MWLREWNGIIDKQVEKIKKKYSGDLGGVVGHGVDTRVTVERSG